MPNLTENFYKLTNTTPTIHYIETGSYRGEGIKEVLNNYNQIHSIELSEIWYNYNVEQFKDNPNVKLYLGDSKIILPKLLLEINEPITVYLDAHYSGGLTAFGDEETPLLFELEILKNRQYDDIIIIDDCRLLGKSGECGAGPNDPIYPTMQFDWGNVTKESILNLLKPGYNVFDNINNEYCSGPKDRLILSKKL
jgi:hypothetical protein